MDKIQEIRNNFDNQYKNGLLELKTYGKKSWTIKGFGFYGVAIENTNNININEHYSNVKLKSENYTLNGEEDLDLLMLTSDHFHLRFEFATICASFLEEEHKNREHIQQDPFQWWSKWRDLLGNSISSQTIFDVIGELMVYKHLKTLDRTTVWKGPEGASVDIETSEHCIEVKSTLNKYRDIVTISSQYQLKERKNAQLYLCKLEKSQNGESIDSLVQELIKLGDAEFELENKLKKLGYPKNSKNRSIKYELLEGKFYEIDEDFPVINMNSFKNDKMPDNIIKIMYDVSLTGLESKSWY